MIHYLHVFNIKNGINPQNEDDRCLEYCAKYHENKNNIKSHPEKVTIYKKLNSNLKFDD